MTAGELIGLHVAQWFEVVGACIALIFCVWYGIIMQWKDVFALHVFSFVAVIAILLSLSTAEFFWPTLVTHESFVWLAIVITCLLTVVLTWRLFELWHVTRNKKS